jgi:hypothetical protein
MFPAERVSIIGLKGAKGHSISSRVVKEEHNSGIAKTTLTNVKKDALVSFLPAHIYRAP